MTTAHTPTRLIIQFLLVSLIVLNGSVVWALPKHSYNLCTKYGIYKVLINEKNNGDNRLVISRDSKVLIDESAHSFYVVDPSSAAPNLGYEGKGIPPLFDLNGDGTKDLIIGTWSGGAHCCYTYDIYSLGPSLKRIWHFFAGDGHLQQMEFKSRVPPDILIEDATFRYYAAGVRKFPIVALHWSDGKFRVDLARMTRWKKRNVVQDDNEEVYEYFVRLYFTGHAAEAVKQMRSGPLPFDEKYQSFHADFVHQLSLSPFFREIKLLNNGKL